MCGSVYPLRPPSVRFITPVYHPNVATGDGAICLDLLKPPPAGTWSAARCGLRVMLLTIRELLREPNVSDPLEADIVSDHALTQPAAAS
jgi:ubiquitin-conjugating enzyme E2 T